VERFLNQACEGPGKANDSLAAAFQIRATRTAITRNQGAMEFYASGNLAMTEVSCGLGYGIKTLRL